MDSYRISPSLGSSLLSLPWWLHVFCVLFPILFGKCWCREERVYVFIVFLSIFYPPISLLNQATPPGSCFIPEWWLTVPSVFLLAFCFSALLNNLLHLTPQSSPAPCLRLSSVLPNSQHPLWLAGSSGRYQIHSQLRPPLTSVCSGGSDAHSSFGLECAPHRDLSKTLYLVLLFIFSLWKNVLVFL